MAKLGPGLSTGLGLMAAGAAWFSAADLGPRAASAFSRQAIECLERSPAPVQRQACAGAELDMQTRALAAALDKTMRQMDTRGQQLLRQSQQAWEAHRDARCAWLGHRLLDEPVAQRIDHTLCLAEMSESRAEELTDFQKPP